MIKHIEVTVLDWYTHVESVHEAFTIELKTFTGDFHAGRALEFAGDYAVKMGVHVVLKDYGLDQRNLGSGCGCSSMR